MTIPSGGSEPAAEPLYLADPDQFELTDFSEVVYCYSELSGETHLLQPFQALILEICAEQPVGLVDLSAMTATILSVDSDDDWIGSNRSALETLLTMHLAKSLQ